MTAPQLVAAAPIRKVAPIITALVLLSAHLWAPSIQTGLPLPLWRLITGLVVLLVLASTLVWLAQSWIFHLTDTELLRRRVAFPWVRASHRLSELSSVGVVAWGPLSITAVRLAFRDGAELHVPIYYANARALFRSTFSQLGSNIAAKSASEA